jgi:hypothetical protein
MRTIKTAIVGLGLVLGLLPATDGIADGFVICNSGIGLTPDEVRDVYTGEKQLSGSVKLSPVDNTAMQEEFLAKVIKLESAKYASLWTKKGFRDGLPAPQVKGGDAEVIAYIKATPGAVGYVRSNPSGVMVVEKF